MTGHNDPRFDDARAMPMVEVVKHLPLPDLVKVSGEMTGPCPRCGGDDRFSINIRKGVFICRHCAPKGGDGLELVQHVLSCDFKAAVAHLVGEAEAVLDPAEAARRRKRWQEQKEKAERDAAGYRKWAIRRAVDLWRSAQPWQGTMVESYFRARGVDLVALGLPFRCFRFLPAHPYVKKIGKKNHTLHIGPALISGVADRKGRLGAVHQTWIDLSDPDGKATVLDPDGKRLASKLVLGSKKGGAIRITGALSASVMVMGEGIETTLSAMAVDAVPGASYWAGVDLGNMAGEMQKIPGKRHSGLPDLSDARAFVPPSNVSRLIFVQDGDSEPKMTRAKLESGLRRAAHLVPGLTGQIVHPGAGVDLNDKLRGK